MKDEADAEPQSGFEPEEPGTEHIEPARARGVLAYMAKNSVAANLLMAVILAGGAMALFKVKREVFPEFELDIVNVTVPYPGASPAEVEQGVVLAVEEAVRGIDDVKEVRSTAAEGAGNVQVELVLGADRDRALADVKTAVDRITSFPEEAERPTVSLFEAKRSVLSLILYGDADDKSLRELAERTRDGLVQEPGITSVELTGVRSFEISIEVSQENQRKYGVTLEQVAAAVRNAAVELPGGGIKTDKGEVLLRLAERRDIGPEFETIPVVSRTDGTEVLLRDIATIRDGFSESDNLTLFNGKSAIRVQVYRVGDEGPIDVSEAVHKYMNEHAALLPAGVHYAVWDDHSEMYAQRQDLLLRNSALGLGLVILILGLFLEVRLAFWVTMGIPISFIGSLIFLPSVDVSINMISLFAFIVTLGMVVDDAIIVGEAVFKHRREGHGVLASAIEGVREVALPVTFAILTTVIAFMPLLFVPGPAGKFFRNIPWVVIAVLAVSWIESLFVLPAHLGEKRHALTALLALPFKLIDGISRALFRVRFIDGLLRQQQRFSHFLEWFVAHVYRPVLAACLRQRYLTVAACVAALALTIGAVAGGRVAFTFLPKIDGDVIAARLEMPVGTPAEVTAAHQERMLGEARALLTELGGEDRLARGVLAEIGGAGMTPGTQPAGAASGVSHLADVMVFLVPPDQRNLSSSEFARRWRERVGDIPGAESLGYRYSTGHSGGSPVHIRLSHPDLDVLERAGERLAAIIRGYTGTYEIKDGTAVGKEQLNFALTPEARSLGITQLDLARQLRSAFFGAEALRQQRGRNELRVYVRRPEQERRTEAHVEQLMVRAPDGSEIPLSIAARVERGRAYTTIKRAQGRRVIDVTADVDVTSGNAAMITSSVLEKDLPKLISETPGLRYTLEGAERERGEMMSELGWGFAMALLAMYALLAVAFRSYLQPLIVLSAIPFGMIGAIWGHVLMGYTLSLMTMFGVVALSGVVVNDSLILVVAVNRFRESGMTTQQAVEAGGQRRFRPILLTSLTTFFGLAPMILEQSMQARFLIPMAISLGFGVLMATVLILLMVPCTYMILEDIGHVWARIRQLWARLEQPPQSAARPAD